MPYNVNNPVKDEPNKLLLPEPADPWLMDQAGISDIQFNTTNTSSNTHPFGRLSPSMEELVNSVLPSEMSLPQIDDNLDVDLALYTTQVRNGHFNLYQCITILIDMRCIMCIFSWVNLSIFDLILE